jgi:hypothetical protein
MPKTPASGKRGRYARLEIGEHRAILIQEIGIHRAIGFVDEPDSTCLAGARRVRRRQDARSNRLEFARLGISDIFEGGAFVPRRAGRLCCRDKRR